MLNSCNFQGKIFTEPKIFGSGDNRVAILSLGVQRNYKDKETDRREYDYLPIKVFGGKKVDLIERYVEKGSNLIVSANAVVEPKYTDKNGVERPQSVALHANEFYFVGNDSNKKKQTGESNISVNETFDNPLLSDEDSPF